MSVHLDLRFAGLDEEKYVKDLLINLESGFFTAAVYYWKGKLM